MSGERLLSGTSFGLGLRPRLVLPRVRLPAAAVSWLQVGPLALVLIALVATPAFLFLAVSFFDYDRTGIYPAFMLDNYKDLLTTPATLRVYVSSLKLSLIVWAINEGRQAARICDRYLGGLAPVRHGAGRRS